MKMWKMINSILAIVILVALASCSDSDSDNSQQAYTGFIPNFSVNLPENVVSNSYLSENSNAPKPTTPTNIHKLNLEENPDFVDCTSVLETLNAWQPVSDQNPAQDTVNDNTGGALGYAFYFYAQSQFYDCNLRQQVREDGVAQQCLLREGEGSANPEELCHENENADISVQFSYALFQNEQLPDDFTRFVGWTVDLDDPAASADVQGMMVNKYLQDDGARTKTRIDLYEDNEKKIVSSTVLVYNTNSNPQSVTRAYFREVRPSDGGTVTENYVVGRHWDRSHNEVISMRVHLKSNVGSVLFVTICQNLTDLEAAIASPCPVGAVLSTTYFDAEGTPIGATADFSSELATSTDSNFDPERPSDNLNTFFNGESIDEYFEINNFAPENNTQP